MDRAINEYPNPTKRKPVTQSISVPTEGDGDEKLAPNGRTCFVQDDYYIGQLRKPGAEPVFVYLDRVPCGSFEFRGNLDRHALETMRLHMGDDMHFCDADDNHGDSRIWLVTR
jgi:hypothetical protein